MFGLVCDESFVNAFGLFGRSLLQSDLKKGHQGIGFLLESCGGICGVGEREATHEVGDMLGVVPENDFQMRVRSGGEWFGKLEEGSVVAVDGVSLEDGPTGVGVFVECAADF